MLKLGHGAVLQLEKGGMNPPFSFSSQLNSSSLDF
jgi:hypothetical protein